MRGGNNNNNTYQQPSLEQKEVKFDKKSSQLGLGVISEELLNICKILTIDPAHLQPK
jgi:hypothetical protein